jgi:hypothetical protein
VEARKQGEWPSFFQVLLKLMLKGREESGDSQPIINEWGGVQVVLGPEEDV